MPGKQQKPVTVELAAAENPVLQEADTDPTLVCSAYKKNRFYLYTKRIPGEDEEREVCNHSTTNLNQPVDILSRMPPSSSNIINCEFIHFSCSMRSHRKKTLSRQQRLPQRQIWLRVRSFTLQWETFMSPFILESVLGQSRTLQFTRAMVTSTATCFTESLKGS